MSIEIILDILLSAIVLFIYHSDFPASESVTEPIAEQVSESASVTEPIAEPEQVSEPVTESIAPTRVSTRSKAKAMKKTPKLQVTVATELDSLTSVELRKLCSDRSIVWRNARGKGKHLKKHEMLALLQTK